MTFNLSTGPEVFERAFGPKWGFRTWRGLMALGVLCVIGATIFGVLHGYAMLRGDFRGPPVVQATNSVPRVPPKSALPSYRLDIERDMTEALADPRYSAETKITIKHQIDLLPFKFEYRRLHGNVSLAELKSPKAVAFFNRRLKESGKDWQITPQNIDSTFGSVILDLSANGPFTAGVKIRGGGGNTFDRTDINGAQTGIDLENTQNNKFNHTHYSAPGAQLK